MSNDVLGIKIYGTNTSGEQLVGSILEHYLQKAQIAYELTHISDVNIFLQKGIASVPAVQVEDDGIISLRRNGSFNKSLREVIKNILGRRNYGMMDRFIIPIDFSNTSLNAFLYGHRMATDVGAIVHALHVYYPGSKDLAQTIEGVDAVQMRKDRLCDFVDKVNVDWGSDIMKAALVDKEFRTGFPGEEILDFIDENSAKLCIIGNKGEKESLTSWFGSVSTKVMNEAHSLVLIVPEKAKYRHVNRVLFAYNDINLDQSCIDELLSFLTYFDAELHLVHVNTEQVDPGYYLTELIQKQSPGITIKSHMLDGEDIVSSINQYADAHNIDIISMATKKRGILEGFFHTSMTQAMAVNSSTPLLVIKDIHH